MDTSNLVNNDDQCVVWSRKIWLELLNCSDPVELKSLMSRIALPNYTWLRKPQVGLYMVRGRTGGSGSTFNLGEVPVTRCVLRIDSNAHFPIVGISYTLGRAPAHATLCAMADAMLQDRVTTEVLQNDVLAALLSSRDAKNQRRQAEVQSTRVEFFSVARESRAGEAS